MWLRVGLLWILWVLIGTAAAAPPCPWTSPASDILESVEKTTGPLADPLFQSCFGENVSEIPADVLSGIFDQARRDPLTHMKTPAIHCLHRAYLLTAELYQKGYQARLLFIDRSPALIGLVNFDSETPTRYAAYQGHWVVAIDVRDAGGKVTPKILDPQFMETPVTYADYFKRTTGQVCHPGPPRGLWDCNYREIRPKSFSIPQLNIWYGFHDQETHAPVAGCDWPLATDVRNQIDSLDPNTDTATVPIPFEMVKSKSPKEITKTLILRTFEAKRQQLEMEIEESRQILSGYEKGTPTGPRATGARVVKDPILGPMVVSQAEADKERRKLEQNLRYLGQYPTILRAVLQNLEQPAR